MRNERNRDPAARLRLTLTGLVLLLLDPSCLIGPVSSFEQSTSGFSRAQRMSKSTKYRFEAIRERESLDRFDEREGVKDNFVTIEFVRSMLSTPGRSQDPKIPKILLFGSTAAGPGGQGLVRPDDHHDLAPV